MEPIEQMLGVVAVLALLGAMLWWMRRRGLVAPLLPRRTARHRLELLERLPLTAQHSLHLVRMAERALLVAVSPSGCVVLDSCEARAVEDARGAGR